MFIQILQDLYDNGADYVDISGEPNGDNEAPRDTIKITVRPEYLSDHSEDDTVGLEQEIEIDYSGDDDDEEESAGFSENDLDKLI